MASCDKPGRGQGWQMDAPLLTYSPQRSAWCQFLQCHQQRGSGTKSQQWENVLSDNRALDQHNANFVAQHKPHLSGRAAKQGTAYSMAAPASNTPVWWLLTFHSWWFCVALISLLGKDDGNTFADVFVTADSYFTACTFKINRKIMTFFFFFHLTCSTIFCLYNTDDANSFRLSLNSEMQTACHCGCHGFISLCSHF